MTRDSVTAWAAAIITLGLIGVFSYFAVNAMWGMNLLAFLPHWWYGVLFATAIVVTAISFGPALRLLPSGDLWDRIDRAAGALPVAIGISLLSGVLFYFLRSQTHFLGDGYTLISVFGVEGAIVRQWPEPGSYAIIRVVQHLLGGESRDTLIRSMQIISIGSGVLYVFSALRLPRYLSDIPRTRLLASITLLCSGALLLYFGYVEYYHLLWAAAMVYLTLALRYLRTGKGLALAVVSFVAVALIHFEALAFALGVVLLLGLKYAPRTLETVLPVVRRRWVFWAALGGGILFIAVASRYVPTHIFLPLFHVAGGDGYAIFSWLHLLDLVNETFVIFPGVLLLAAVIMMMRHSPTRDRRSMFLGLTCFGALLFLITVDPVLGVARDWDLMSLPLLPLGLYVIYRYHGRLTAIAPRAIISYFLVCAFITSAFIAGNVRQEPSEQRFASFLKLYGTREKSGWAILDYYYLNEGRPRDALALSQEMLARGIRPADAHFAMGMAYRKQGDINAAVSHLETASRLQSGKPRWLNELGQAYLDQGNRSRALNALNGARRLAPSWTPPLESLALVAIRGGDDTTALAYADTLLMQDPESPGGNLIYMVVELNRGNKAEAEHHYENFVNYGKGRSDYSGILEYYGPRFQ